MPFIYSATIGATGAPDSTAPIPLPAIGRYTRPWGTDLGKTFEQANHFRHLVPRHLQFVPFKPAETMSFDRIGLRYFDLNNCVDTWYYKFGLYAAGSNDYPSTLIADYGVLTIDPAAPPSPYAALEITVNQQLVGGTLYWIAIGVNQSGGTDQGANRTPLLGLMNGDFLPFRKRGMVSGAGAVDGVAWAEQINSFPGTFPASTSFSVNPSSASIAIRPQLRRSA